MQQSPDPDQDPDQDQDQDQDQSQDQDQDQDQRPQTRDQEPNPDPEPSTMEQTQVLRSLLLLLLLLPPPAAASRGQRVDETCCFNNLENYYTQMNLPIDIGERSITPWSYVKNIDLNRVPQIIHEASCHTSHSCGAIEGAYSLETIPVTLRVPVLKKNPACFPLDGYTIDYELITVACLCAKARSI